MKGQLLPLLLLLGCNGPLPQKEQHDAKPPAAVLAEPTIDESVLIFFKPLPESFPNSNNPATAEKVTLGRMLFFDARLSKNHDVSCNSCHGLDTYGVDGKRFSTGHKGQLGGRNSPTVYNAGDHIAQFWDGRAADLEAQAKGPVVNPLEMANTEKNVVATLKSIPEYVDFFKRAFPKDKDPVTFHNMALAIAAFERGLVTPGRFDKFLQGDAAALSDLEKQGLATFAELGCVTCHNGPAVGGSSFQRIGQIIPYESGNDLGRFEVTKNPVDKRVFRVPSLRNVAKTAPYFSDGALPNLDITVRTMAKHQLGKTPTDEQVKAIVAFLEALTGDLPSDYIQKPELPASTAKTPKPDPS